MRRIRRHFILALLSAVLLILGERYLLYPDAWERVSVASAWLCMFYLCGALLIGPIYRMEGRRIGQVNIYIRRDVGIWAALTGWVHFIAGNVVAMNPIYLAAFVHGIEVPPSTAVREQLFNGGSVAGTAVALLFLLLLVLSTDWSLRRLRPKLWKKLQGVAIVSLWLTALHAVAFQLLEGRLFPLLIILVATLGVLGFRLRVKLKSR